MSGAEVRIAGIERNSIVDGPGLRYVVFAQGCPRRCEGCHNPQSLPLDGGRIATVADILEEISSDELLSGVTLSGGEPFLQPQALAQIAQGARGMGLNVWAYTGYTFEELADGGDTARLALLQSLDVLVDGPYVASQRSLELRFRGSANQRVIDVPASLRRGKAVPLDLDIP
jgi:anaerobic ribonucleoside-triphosphate reductase activating protein